ncbi:eukaryotic-type carbonic anhydrase family protein [Thraustotheca clavata]|uniref:Carbonic anhydrase n=1 Tax=Thraustotheca clavata TaxID=74557 RepID=A0A1W0A7S0_9STRA|nr:eukaryotic-type carbonic anhydrase family protein [Thraustotheca clavata]
MRVLLYLLVLVSLVAAALKEQSPIDISTDISETENKNNIAISHKSLDGKAKHTGTAFKVFWKGSTLVLDGVSYEAAQLHFHTPSEHTFDGKHYPLEMHIVHSAVEKNHSLAVVGILFDYNKKSNGFLKKFWSHLDDLSDKGDTIKVKSFDAADLKLDNSSYFRYPGSLTTPPYTEGVQWAVMKSIQHVSRSQVRAIKDVFDDNSRAVQPLNDRKVILYSKPSAKLLSSFGVACLQVILKEKTFTGLQFHFHAPSEHRVRGYQYPFEMHMVHQATDKSLAVLGVFFEVGPKDNEFLNQVWPSISQLGDSGTNVTVSNIAGSILRIGAENGFYRYQGSLTTPPYTKGVEWTVVHEVQKISQAQLDAYKEKIKEDNAREVQPLNNRQVCLYQPIQ